MTKQVPVKGPYITVLGTAQDAGYPAAGCYRSCCARAAADPELRQYASCLAIVDPQSGQRWLIDCTPDFREQLQLLDKLAPADGSPGIDGILLTHAHIGHYLGLVHLGREAMDVRALPVYAMPRMGGFLRGNAPWKQLVELGQIEIMELSADVEIKLNDQISVTPKLVPHRGEYSETVGYRITGPERTVFYLPDIDGWEDWRNSIQQETEQSDVLYLDGTFYSGDELPGRNMSEIPHPTIEASLAGFAGLPPELKRKIRFIHFNHTNPLVAPGSSAERAVLQAGFGLARQGEAVHL